MSKKRNSRPRQADLLKTHTAAYEGPTSSLHEFAYFHDRPRFRLFLDVPAMMLDARVQMSLWYLKGSILSLSRFFVDEGDDDPNAEPSDIKRFVIKQIERWWRTSVVKQMSALEYGFSGSEILYCHRHGQIHFDSLRLILQRDCRAVTKDGSLCGMQVVSNSAEGKIFLGTPKSLWHVHQREVDPFYGRSRLKSAFEPWTEKHCKGGARDTRKLYFYRKAFAGETLYHPPGSIQDENGVVHSFKDVAQTILNQMRSGGTLALPSVFDAQTGNRMWELADRPESVGSGEMLEYYDALDDEIAEGIGIPAEAIEANETGSGYSGRRISKDAFLGMLSDPLMWLINDYDEQCIRPLVRLNFGVDEPEYSITPFGLVRDSENQTETEVAQQPTAETKINDKQRNAAQFSLVI